MFVVNHPDHEPNKEIETEKGGRGEQCKRKTLSKYVYRDNIN
jgi:hypothetical protein